MVGRGGFEPPTSRLSSARSNQLSYQPKSDVSSKAVSVRPGAARRRSKERTFEMTTEGMRGRRHGCRDPASVVRVTERRPSEEDCTVHILRKEVIQPQVPLRLPCYDFTPVADLTVVGCLLAVSAPASGKTNSHGVTGGVYKARERIHRSMLICDY